ncbi:MAG: tryptophan--tRNA ligase [Parcubacteria group bacterium]|nr:tryptophan--tRNA ligase [Parcubacteria group bacterium]
MRIVSGIQPTGKYHIGNYLGAIRHWIKLQEEHECFFFVADLHAITLPQDPEELKKATLQKIIELVALGLSTERCCLFVQSHIQEAPELAWIFSTITPIGELERMTQYKDKKNKTKDSANAGLFLYPTLMAADILLYKAEGVPVGQDQLQHLELTRETARRFNKRFGETFLIPKAMVPELGAKILSLTDPKRKMSKSDPLDSQILLLDEPDAIRKKIFRAVTDRGTVVSYDPAKKPGISNLLTVYSLFAEISVKEVERKFAKKGYAVFKKALADLLVRKLEPFRRKYAELASRDVYVQEIIKQGAKRASSVAQDTMEEVRGKVGFLQV